MAKIWLTGNRFVPRISLNIGGFFCNFHSDEDDLMSKRIYLSKEHLALNSFHVLDPKLFALEVVICFARIKVRS